MAMIAYRRVSSFGQSTERQLDGMTFDEEFTDKLSGASMERPALLEMLRFCRKGDQCHVHSMDRLARNLRDLLQIVTTLNSKGVVVNFHKENLSFTGDDSATSKLMLGIMGAVSEFERSMIRQRQYEGVQIAKAKGNIYKGGKPKLTPVQAVQLRERALAGEKKAVLAREFGISRETVYQYLRAGSAA
jgi:DNA invertase Pin-like site-specific DNA recombinase